MAASDRADFRKKFSARTKGSWKKAREAKATRNLNVPEGKYIVRFTRAIPGLDKNQNPFVQFRFVVLSSNPDYDGQTGSKAHFITPPRAKKPGQKWTPKTVEEKLESLAKDFQRLGFDTSEMDDDAIYDACEQITKDKPLGAITVKEPDEEGRELIIWIDGLVDEDRIPEGSAAADGGGDEDDGDDAEEEEEEDEEESDEDESEDEQEEEEESEDDEESEEESDDEEDEEEDEEEESDEEEPPEDYDDEEEEEEEEEEPAPKKAAGKKAAKKAPAKKSTKKASAKPKVGAKVKWKGKVHVVKAVAADAVTLMRESDKRIFRGVAFAELS